MSTSAELLKKVRRIEIKTRGLSSQVFSGEYHSAFKGRGMAFSEVREYLPGDDVRAIDWNVTARLNHPYVKVFEEERELTIMLLVDVSASGSFGSETQLKRELMIETSALLAFSALKNNDKVGVIFFSSAIEKFIPPQKGRTHVLRIIRELVEFKPQYLGTDVATALSFFTNVIKKRSTAFLLSDFVAPDFSRQLRIASSRHDMVALRIHDIRESFLPDVGLVLMKDAESGRMLWVDSSSKSVRNHFMSTASNHRSKVLELFRKNGVDSTDLQTGKPIVQPLMRLFQSRGNKRA